MQADGALGDRHHCTALDLVSKPIEKMEVGIQGYDRVVFTDRQRSDLGIACAALANVGHVEDVQTALLEVPERYCAAGPGPARVGSCGAQTDDLVVEALGSVLQRLADIVIFELRVLPLELGAIRIDAAASTTRRTVRRMPRIQGWPFICSGSMVMRSNGVFMAPR
jgi:hypothetical protein